MSLLLEGVDIRGTVEEALTIGAASVEILPQRSVALLLKQAQEIYQNGIYGTWKGPGLELEGHLKSLYDEFRSLIDRDVNSPGCGFSFNRSELFKYRKGVSFPHHTDPDIGIAAIWSLQGSNGLSISFNKEDTDLKEIDNTPGRVVVLRQGQRHSPNPTMQERYSFAMRYWAVEDPRFYKDILMINKP